MTVSDLDDDALERLVHAFYARVRADAVLGPVFNDAVGDWPEHLDKLSAFWSSVMLTTGRYKGNPMMAHFKHVSRITPGMFERWLGLWREMSDAMLSPEGAAAVQAKAARIAESLQLGLFYRIDQPAARKGAA